MTLTTAEKRAYLALLEEQERRRRYNLIDQLFPEDGTLSRHNYAKHLEFFRAGAIHKERLFMAGNRCVTPWTFIETASGSARAAEALFGCAGNLRAWADGSERDVRPVDAHLVGIEPAFRVVLDSGRFFDCSRKHRVLTDEGWLSLDQLVSRADGLHWSHTAGGYQASCVAGGYLDDRPLPPWSDSAQGQLPSPSGARTHSRLALSREDAEARTPRHIRVCQRGGHPASFDDRHRVEALSEPFSAAATDSDVLPLTWTHRAFRQLALASDAQPQSGGEARHHQAASHVDGLPGSLFHVAAGRPAGMPGSDPENQRSDRSARLFQCVDVFPGSAGRLGIFYPSRIPRLVGGETIAAIVPIGFQPIIDAHVPGLNNYRAAGVYHHNCGKTIAGGAEIAYHMTGRYPEWWEGRRFDRPINALAAGDTSQTTRDIIQKKLLGGLWDTEEFGTGLIPRALLGKPTPARGVANLYEEISVKHASGGWSRLMLRSYDQGRRIFQGTEQDVVWLDEEVPKDVYDEALIRTMTTHGIVIMTFTPLSGLTELVVSFLESKHEQESV